MARASRESIYAALLTKLATADANLDASLKFQTKGRRLVHWDQVPSQPALFLKQGMQESNQNQAMFLTKVKLTGIAVIYFKTEGMLTEQGNYADQYINAYIDAVEKVLDPIPGKPQTLGGLVLHCWLDGTIISDDGTTDNQAVIALPISMIVGV